MDRKNIETLPEYVRRIRTEKRISTIEIERRSAHMITDGYVSHIENGYVKNVSPEKLKALARGLGVPEEEIFAVARGVPNDREGYDDSDFAKMYSRAKNLTGRQKREFEVGWKMLKEFLDRLEREQALKEDNM